MRMMFSSRLASAALALAVGALGCNSKSNNANDLAASKLTFKGVVTDENQVAIANANILVGDILVQTDAQGGYVAQPNYKLGASAIFHVTAAGFGARSESVAVDSVGLQQNFILRKNSVTQTVALPTVAGGNVQVSFVALDPNAGGVTLTLEANQLVNAAGAVVQGNVDVSITYWSPTEPLTNTPAPMQGYASAADTGGNALISYGMGDIDIRQAGEALHIAGGANLLLSFHVPPDFADNVNQLVPADMMYPRLWSVDTNTGVWIYEGDATSGHIAFDVNTSLVQAKLPHLSAWNIDGVTDGSQQGCVQGTLVDCNNKPVANTDAWLWMIGKQTLEHSLLHSGADGSFCGSVTGVGALNKQGIPVGSAYWWVSLPQAPNSTMQCNASGRTSFVDLCRGKPASTMLCRSTEPQQNQDKWDASIAACHSVTKDFTMCGYCPNTTRPSGRCTVRYGNGETFLGPRPTSGQCTNMGNVQIPTAACTSNTSTVDPCKGKGDMTGQRCSVDADCCPQSALECADGACVPRSADVN